MNDILKNLAVLSFEIGNDCNLKHEHHDKCPINHRIYRNKNYELSIEKILKCIDEAVTLGFNGHIAFHYYNEPLLYKDKIETIINLRKERKYLLITNGLLLDRNVDNNSIIELFDRVYITCYNSNDMCFFKGIKNKYANVKIFDWELDDRVQIYTSEYKNLLGCKRPQFELPIDYYGNIHLCCCDWNNQHYIGNVYEKTLHEILISPVYKNILQMTKQRMLDYNTAPEVCKRCKQVVYIKLEV